MTDTKRKRRKKYRKGHKADYRGATPDQVARAVFAYRAPQRRRFLQA